MEARATVTMTTMTNDGDDDDDDADDDDDERPATTTMTKRLLGVSSPGSYCASRLPPSSHRTYVALLIKWRSVLRIFTAAPMSLTPARPAPEAPAAEPVGESSPPPSPTGGASPTTPPDPQPKQTEPEQADPQPKRLEPDPKLGTRTQSQSRRRRLGRAEKGKAAASTLAVMWAPITESERPVRLQLWDPAPATLGALSESPFVGAPDAVTLQGPPWPPYWHLQTPARPASFHRRRRRRRRRRPL